MRTVTVESRPLPYPGVDPAMGEKLYPDEEALAGQIANAVEKTVRGQYQAGNAHRDVHSKAHGCVRAELRIADTLPANLAKGIFVPGMTYKAWIRFSNGSSDAHRADDKGDARGMAIKVMGVPGEKLLRNERNATTQDFILINHPVFFANEPARYLSLTEKSNSGSMLRKLTIPFTLGFRGSLIAWQTSRSRISNPLQTRYWSMVPYQLGNGPDRQAVKFSVIPCTSKKDSMPDHPGPDYLRESLRDTLARGGACMELLVQPRTSEKMSVEDSMTEWKESEAPFYRVATLHIPAQEFDTVAENRFCENLSFNPWHTLPAHRPLGATNRMRKIIYDQVSRVRHEMNDAGRGEP